MFSSSDYTFLERCLVVIFLFALIGLLVAIVGVPYSLYLVSHHVHVTVNR